MAVTIADVAALALPAPQRLRKEWPFLGRIAERAYAAAVSAAAGGWLTDCAGPAVPPMPALAVVLVVACAVPWWASRPRRAKVRLERTLESWPEIARAVGLAGSQIMSAMVDLWGWRARFAGPGPDHPRRDRESTRHRIRSGHLPGRDPRLSNARQLRQPVRAARARCRPARRRDPVARPVRLLDHRAHRARPVRGRGPLPALFLRRHVLFGGATGSGKSGGLNVLIGNLSACRDVVLWGIDLKRGWNSARGHRALTDWPPRPTTPTRCWPVAVAVLEARAAAASSGGRRIWEPTPAMACADHHH